MMFQLAQAAAAARYRRRPVTCRVQMPKMLFRGAPVDVFCALFADIYIQICHRAAIARLQRTGD